MGALVSRFRDQDQGLSVQNQQSGFEVFGVNAQGFGWKVHGLGRWTLEVRVQGSGFRKVHSARFVVQRRLYGITAWVSGFNVEAQDLGFTVQSSCLGIIVQLLKFEGSGLSFKQILMPHLFVICVWCGPRFIQRVMGTFAIRRRGDGQSVTRSYLGMSICDRVWAAGYSLCFLFRLYDMRSRY